MPVDPQTANVSAQKLKLLFLNDTNSVRFGVSG